MRGPGARRRAARGVSRRCRCRCSCADLAVCPGHAVQTSPLGVKAARCALFFPIGAVGVTLRCGMPRKRVAGGVLILPGWGRGGWLEFASEIGLTDRGGRAELESSRRAALTRGTMDRPPERDEARFLDRLGERRVRRHPVGDRLDRRLRVERDDAGLDQVGDVRADHDEPEQLAVPRLVDRLHPADGLVLHHGARVRDPREHADARRRRRTARAPRPRSGRRRRSPDPCRSAAGRARLSTTASWPIAFSAATSPSRKRRVRELPVPGAVADRVDVRDGRPAVLVGGDPLAPVELDADLLEPEPLDERPRGRPRRASGRRRRSRPRRSGRVSPPPRVLDLRALLLEVERDPRRCRTASRAPWPRRRPPAGISVGSISMIVTSEPKRVEDRRELAADDPAAEDDEPRAAPSSCASRPVESTHERASRARRSAGAAGTSRSRRPRS